MKIGLSGTIFCIFVLSVTITTRGNTTEFQWGAPGFITAEGSYYIVRSDTGAQEAQNMARELDLRFEIHNRLFRFSPSSLPGKLKVTIFSDQGRYDAYIQDRLGMIREGAVYLHYNQGEKRELVIHSGSKDANRIYPHQAFVQYIRAFINNPPAWMREGFAIYFSGLSYDPASDELQYEENLAWLETVKGWGNSKPPLEAVATTDMGAELALEIFQPAAWALTSFLLNAENDDYRRNLFEAFMVLEPEATAAENAGAVLNRVLPWLDIKQVAADYSYYLDSRKTFNELIEAGRKAYAQKNEQRAELYFLAALDLKPTHYAPYYYLGLLSYEQKDHDMAENHYKSALQYGADNALVQYALGLNAGAAGRQKAALDYLSKAAQASPERYKARVEELLPRLRTSNP